MLQQINVDGLGWHSYVCVEMNIVPSMCREFDPDPDQVSYRILKVDTYDGVVTDLSYHEAKDVYRNVVGKDDRICFWHALKHIKEYSEEEAV